MNIGSKVMIVSGSGTCFSSGQIGTIKDMTSFSVGIYIDGIVQWFSYSDIEIVQD